MKFTANSKTLLAKLTAASKAIENRPRLPILSNFLFNLKDGSLSITASDGDSIVTTRMESGASEGEGQVCINAKRFTELVKLIHNCDVTINVDDKTKEVSIRHPQGKYRIVGIHAGEYPLGTDLENGEPTASLRVSAPAIIRAIDGVEFAAATDDARPVFNGIHWDLKESDITLVATDTRSMAVYTFPRNDRGAATSFTTPAKVNALIRAFISRASELDVRVSTTALTLSGDDFIMRVPLLNGRYPDYNRVIPATSSITAVMGTDEMVGALSRLSTCVSTDSSWVKLSFSALSVKAETNDLGEGVAGEESIHCECDGSIAIGFNAPILRKAVNAVTASKVMMKMREPGLPALLIPTEQDGTGEYKILCMPVTIK